MWIQQIFVALLCLLLTLQCTHAVVNSGQSLHNTAEDTSSNTESAESVAHQDSIAIEDSVAAATSDQEANRRDAPLSGLADSYGPLVVPHETYGPPIDNAYIPPSPNNADLPVPVYGVPNAPGNIVVYSGSPPDIPPALSSLHVSFNAPQDTYGPPREVYGPPKGVYGPPKEVYGPPKEFYGPPVKDNYGPPPLKYGPPRPVKPFHPPPFHKPLKHHYGPPRPQYGPPPKLHFGGPKLPKPQYGPPFKSFHGPSKPIYGPPKQIYGPPKLHGPPPPPPSAFYGPPHQDKYGPPKPHNSPLYVHQHYGPPDPVPHGPPHPGAPAPPTPPDIKYDGWQPIPGLVSRPPADSYGIPQRQPYTVEDLQFNGDFVPPPAEHHQQHGVQSLSLGTSYGSSAGISDSYGAPLNTVTGSGGIVSTSGDAHINNQDQNAISLGLSAAGIAAGHDNSLSVIKSIGYEIHPNGGFGVIPNGGGNHIGGPLDTYGAPTINSYSTASGPFISSGNSYKLIGKGPSLSVNSIGLIPPSGFYGAVPSGHRGTPLLTPPSPPKRPISFRDQSLGPTYIHQSVQQNEPPILTNIYTLPTTNNPTSFQNIGHGLSFDVAPAQSLTSYNAPLNTVDNTYGIPGGIGIAQNIPGNHIDLTHINVGNSIGSASYAVPSFNVPHDCSMYKSQPLPPLTYGIPLANSYTAPLSSKHTNIGGPSSGLYGTPDLQAAHSQITDGSVANEISDDEKREMHGKAMAEHLALGGELIQSQSIDFNNIPVQGNLGSYTLQIQSADGLESTGQGLRVQHDQVLNDGLLQSILAAIEQPNNKNVQILGQPLYQFQPGASDEPLEFSKDDGEAQNSMKNPIVVAAPSDRIVNSASDVPNTDNDADETDTTESLQLIDNNEIALYFSNKIGDESQMKTDGSSTGSEKDKNSYKDVMDLDDSRNEENISWNAQQYGSFVSMKTPNTNYKFGNRKIPQQDSSQIDKDPANLTGTTAMAMDDPAKSDTTTVTVK